MRCRVRPSDLFIIWNPNLHRFLFARIPTGIRCPTRTVLWISKMIRSICLSIFVAKTFKNCVYGFSCAAANIEPNCKQSVVNATVPNRWLPSNFDLNLLKSQYVVCLLLEKQKANTNAFRRSVNQPPLDLDDKQHTENTIASNPLVQCSCHFWSE